MHYHEASKGCECSEFLVALLKTFVFAIVNTPNGCAHPRVDLHFKKILSFAALPESVAKIEGFAFLKHLTMQDWSYPPLNESLIHCASWDR
jgi:hypothetical protein